MTNDLRKEQAVLLRFEKQIAGLAATLAALGTAAKAADGKLHAPEASTAYADLQASLVQLAEATSQAHAAVNAKAMEVGATVLQASGGTPKRPPSEVVASILGLG